MDNRRMALAEHFTDLKKMITWCLIALAVGMAIGFWQVEWLLERMIALMPDGHALTYYSPAEAFMAELKIAFYAGLVLAIPVIFASVAWFVAPGLTEKEKFWMPLVVLISLALFFVGFVVAYFSALPIMLDFLFSVTPDHIGPAISISQYLTFILNILLVFGILLQIPFAVLLVLITGLVEPKTLAKQRTVVIIGIITMGFVLGGGVDPITQVILFGPIYILFEISLFAGTKWRQLILRRRKLSGVK